MIEQFKAYFKDVGFRYLLSKSGRQWVVALSMVGLYSTIFRLSEIGLSELVALYRTVSEEKIYSLLSNYGLKVLSKSEFEKPITLKLRNAEPDDVCVYRAPFSDTDILLWTS